MKNALWPLALLAIICFPVISGAEEICTIGMGYPVSASKSVINQVAHHEERGDEKSQKTIDFLKKDNRFYVTSKRHKVEIIKRSGALVHFRIIDTPKMLWTTERAISCY